MGVSRGQGRFGHSNLRLLPSLLVLAGAVACAEQPGTPPVAGNQPPAAAAAEPDPASQGVLDRRGKAGASVFVAHIVSDFAAFQKFFDEGAPDREKVGVKGHVLTKLDDGRVVVHLFANDLDALKLTLASPRMQEYLGRSGSPDASLVWLAYDELLKLPAQAPSGQTFSLFYKLRMTDLPALRRGFINLQPLFTQQGVIASGLHHSVEQSDLVFLHFVGTARDKLEALTKDPNFLEWLASRGTTDPPQSLIGEDVSRSRTYYGDLK
jgi:hypothetical protein